MGVGQEMELCLVVEAPGEVFVLCEEPWKAFRQQHTMIRCALFQEDSAAEWRSGWKKPSSKEGKLWGSARGSGKR